MQSQNLVAANVPSETQKDDARLVKVYKELFDVVSADCRELLEETYRLRYQVYCLETGFENKDDFENEMEMDIYDSQSVSSLLIHKNSKSVAGTVRIILPKDGDNVREIPALSISEELRDLDEATLPRDKTAEISRFSVSKKFRQRHYDTHIPGIEEKAGHEESQRVIPHITLGLMTAIVRMSIENNITHWAVVMEPALQRLLRKLGIRFTAIGPIIEYHGRRRTHYSDVDSLLNGIYEERPEIWNVITDCGALYPYTGDK
ncbi:PEP-CTERM/exosortase system-associated acyltransferase [Emcibacter sp.]|uniref:PEP-CTERM/exosortase system-associated acyltransferase n=1 Tax=Emcibacter sp. TaxID=1979954 RepID=UPI002AA6378E|nr:PEP-CTERM/exosortase system-associated acyltransferase [Emcibacter sp.]